MTGARVDAVSARLKVQRALLGWDTSVVLCRKLPSAVSIVRCGRPRRCWVVAAFASLVALLACSPSALAFAAAPTGASEELAVLGRGVVWIHQGQVRFEGFPSGSVSLGSAPGFNTTLASSSSAVALNRGSNSLDASIPPSPLERIEGLYEGVSGSGCSSWLPALSPDDFAVVGDEIVSDGECLGETASGASEQQTATGQPLFIRRLHGGTWRVLWWLRGDGLPVLVAEGSRLAIGVQVPHAEMRVTVLDLATRKLKARFDLPSGHLSFASSTRVVLSVPLCREARPITPLVVDTPPAPRVECGYAYRIALYSMRGRKLADLGVAPEPPLVSHMHFLAEESLAGGQVLALRSVLGGASQPLIGLNPARSLVSAAFRWPAVAVVEWTRNPLSQSEVTCQSGQYHLGQPSLRVFDLARTEPFVPPPPTAHLIEPTGCPIVIPPLAPARRTVHIDLRAPGSGTRWATRIAQGGSAMSRSGRG